MCSSLEGRLVGTLGFNVETGGFPRGVWVGEGGAVVGVSIPTDREMRDSTDCELAIYDERWRECDRIRMKAQGMVLDIAALPTAEVARG